MTPDALPPHSLPDERGVLSCVLQDAEHCLSDCSHLTEAFFFDQFHKLVWLAVESLVKENAAVNEISVSRVLSAQNIEGFALKIAELANEAPSPHNLGYYLPALFEKFVKRRIVKGCHILSQQAMNGATVEQVMATAERLLSIQSVGASPIHDGKTSTLMLMDDLERRMNLRGALPGLDTGFDELNDKLDGFQFGEQTLIAARPSVGKTAIGLGVFTNCIFNLKIPALFVSLEMSTSALMRRMLSNYSEINMGELRRGNYTEGTFQKMTTFSINAKKSPMAILDGSTGMSITELCASVRRHVKKHAARLVVVDYLQKVRPSERHEKRTYEVADVSGRLKALAVETKAAFVTLAQLNRDSEKDKKPRLPRLGDLADSGQIERDADCVILLDRNRSDLSEPARLIIAKQRDGETGCVRVRFNGSLCRFENIPKIDQGDYPPTHNDP